MSRQAERARLFASAVIAGGALCASALFAPSQASAKSMKECGVEYQTAKKAGTLNGETWQAFRASHCAADGTPVAPPATTASGATAPASAAPATTATTAPTATAATGSAPAAAPATTAAPAAAATATAAGAAVFPTAVSGKYSSLSAGKARMNTCLDQYKANKTTNGNGDLKWIQRGGGYYSQCNKRLKGG